MKIQVWTVSGTHRGCECCGINDSTSVEAVETSKPAAEAKAVELEKQFSWTEVHGPFEVEINAGDIQ